jgi:hypothetical protein
MKDRTYEPDQDPERSVAQKSVEAVRHESSFG